MCPACMTSMALIAAGSTSASALAGLALTQTRRDAYWVCGSRLSTDSPPDRNNPAEEP